LLSRGQPLNCFGAEHLRVIFESKLGSELNTWKQLAPLFFSNFFHKNDHIVRAGESWGELCFIHEGLLRVYYSDSKGREVNQHFYERGEVIYPVSDNSVCKFNIQALESTTLMIANYQDLSNRNAINTEWGQIELNLLKSSFLKNAKREARLLIADTENRYLWFCREYPQLVKKLPQYQIASFLGVTPVTLSRLKLNTPEF